MPTDDLLKRLCEASGVSGYESEAASAAVAALTPFADEVRVDAMGSVIAVKRASRGDGSAGSVLLAGHLDEIGLIVSALDRGFLRFTRVGGFDPRVLPGQEVIVHGRRPLPGIIGSRPPHVLPPEARDAVTPMDELFIDVGLTSGEVAQVVSVGDIITVARQSIVLKNGRIAAKAMDDRSAVAAIVECFRLMEHTRNAVDVYGVATVQEEASDFLGARTSAYALQPDIAIAIDVGHAEAPDVGEVPIMTLGKGPGIGRGPNLHPSLYDRLVKTAEEIELPWQADPNPGATGTDAWAIQVVREGIPTALLSIPLRYMHTSVETVAVKDVDRTGRLLCAFIGGLDSQFMAGLRGC